MAIFKVFRYNPESDEIARFQEYEIPDTESMTVLEGLYYILENIDPTLAFRSSCREGVCGSCAMHINGEYRLACETQVSDMGHNVTIRPLAHMKIIRDLVVDLTPFFDNYEKIKPYLINSGPVPDKEFKQSPKERKRIDHHVDCILCGACYGSCPVLATDSDYLGPHALLKVLRFVDDSRDDAAYERLAYVATDYGIFRCHTIFNCQQVCPKDLDPTGAIGKLKMKAVKGKLLGKLKKTGT